MSEYRLPREILGMVGNELAISTIDIGTFVMARDLYGDCIPTQIFEVDKLRFSTKPKRSKRKSAYPAKFAHIKGLAHWLYKRCEPSKRDSYKAHYENILEKDNKQQEQIQNEIMTVIKEFESTQNVRTASKSLERIWGGDAFIVSTLFLSTAFSDTISFLSPELTYCFNLDTGLEKDESEFSRDARLHDALQTRVEKTIERFSPKLITRPEVEQVAYVLRLLAKLKESYYEPGLVSRQGPLRRDGIIFKAKVKNRNNNPFPDVSRPLAMKEQSIIGDHRIIDYLNEVKISSELNCVNVIAFHGWTYTNQHIRIVMDRMKTDLENRLKDHRKWNKRNSRHDPDSKPLLNIFLDKEDNVVLGDFGVSKQARDGNETTLATFTGTTAYIAPEVLGVRRQDTAYTSKADVWALGCVLYRMLSGHPLIKDHKDKDEVITAVNNFKEKRIVKPRRLPKVPTKCQYEFLDGLLDCTVDSRLSVTDALSQCSVWKDY